MAGQFPDYTMVLVKPDQVTAQFSVPHAQFADALKRVALCADERSHATKFELGFNELLLSSAASDVGNAEEGIPIEYTGESLTSAFNASYLLDLVSLEVSNVLAFEIKNALAQWQVTVPFADGKFVAVHMPLRLPQYPLQSQGAGSMLLTGDMPYGPKPKPQRLARVMENRSGGDGNWIQSVGAQAALPVHRPSRWVLTAGTDKTPGPTELGQIVLARLFRGEAPPEIQLVHRIIFVHRPKSLRIVGTVLNWIATLFFCNDRRMRCDANSTV